MQCFVAKTMHTVNKNTFHRVYLLITKLLYNIKIMASQSNLYKSLHSQTQARSQKTEMGGGCFRGLGAEPAALESFVLFDKNNLN